MLILVILMIFKVSADILSDFYKYSEYLDTSATIKKLNTALEAEIEKLKERSPEELDHLVKNIEKLLRVELKKMKKNIITKEEMMELKKLRAAMRETKLKALELSRKLMIFEELDYSTDETQPNETSKTNYTNLIIELFIFLILIIIIWCMLK